MFQHENLSLASITSDEIRWLTADARILQEPGVTPVNEYPPSSPINIKPASSLSESNGKHASDSLSATFPRSKGTPRRGHHHYQRSTKSSSAKVVAPNVNHRSSRSFGNKRPLHPQLNCSVTPATDIHTTDSPQSPEASSSLQGPYSVPDTLFQTPPRPVKRMHSYSSTHNGSPGSEWIYRQPKSPSISTSSAISAIRYNRRTESGSSSATPSPASTRDSSRCPTPTSTNTYRPDVTDYFPVISAGLGNSTSSLHRRAASAPDGNADGSSFGSTGSIGVLVPSSFGFTSSDSPIPLSTGSGTSSSSTFWTHILRTRSGSHPNPGAGASSIPNFRTNKPSRLSPNKASAGSLKASQNEVRGTDTGIPSLWSGANVDCLSGTSPIKRRGKEKGKRSIRELGITPLLPLPDAPDKTPSGSSIPVYSPLKKRALYARSGSLSSSTSTSTSASASPPLSTSVSSMSSSPPTTPTAPTHHHHHIYGSGGVGKTKKFQPHHRCIIEDIEDDESGGSAMDAKRRKSPSPTKSILSSRTPYYSEYPLNSDANSTKFDSGVSLGLDKELENVTAQRKNSACTTGSNKSVKFADTPTVHYASGVYSYESWDGMTGAGPFDLDMGIDVDDMELDSRSKHEDDTLQQIYTHPYARPHPYAAQSSRPVFTMEPEKEDAEDRDTVSAQLRDFDRRSARARAQELEREESCATPTPEVYKEKESVAGTGTGSLRRLVSLKRKPSSASSSIKVSLSRTPSTLPARSAIPRPTISGPYALGSMTHSSTNAHSVSVPPLPTTPSTDGHGLDLRGAGLRSAPSLESFRSAKSGGTKSVRSLKSLPESVKSSVSLRAKGMKDWFKGRVTVGVNVM